MTRRVTTTSPDGLDLFAALCERLNLPEVARLAAARAQQAAAEQWTYSPYLTDLFQAEVTARQARYVVSHTQMARLPFQKTLEQFDFSFQPSIDERRCGNSSRFNGSMQPKISWYSDRPAWEKRI